MGPVRSFSSLGSEENKQIGRFHYRGFIVIYSNMVKSWSEPILIENSVALQGPTKKHELRFYTFFFSSFIL